MLLSKDELVLRVCQLLILKDGAYAERNACVALILRLCLKLGYKAGMRKDPDGKPPYTTVAMFDLPTGQCGFHIPDVDLGMFAGIPDYEDDWDGHTTQIKWERMTNYR